MTQANLFLIQDKYKNLEEQYNDLENYVNQLENEKFELSKQLEKATNTKTVPLNNFENSDLQNIPNQFQIIQN